MKKWMTLILCVCLIASLAACSQGGDDNGPVLSQSQSDNETQAERSAPLVQEGQAPQGNDEFYPISGSQPHHTRYFWLSDGKIIAVPNKGEIQYIGLNNQLVNAVTIPDDKLIGDYEIVLADNRILVMGNDLSGLHRTFMTIKTEGEWILVNGSFWDDEGNIIRELRNFRLDGLNNPEDNPDGSDREFLLDSREIVVEDMLPVTPVWINNDLIAVHWFSHLFFYRISTDTLTLVDDMSDWIGKYGNFQVYYGVDVVMPTENGCYYFAHKNEEKSNSAGTVWYADEAGTEVLFDGREFRRVIYENGMLLMIDWPDDMNATRLWYATDSDWTLRELAAWDSFYSIQERVTNGCFVLIDDNEPYRFYSIDTLDAALSSYVPQIENCRQYEVWGVRKNNGSLQYIYSTFIDGELDYYIFDTGTGTNRKLDSSPFPYTNIEGLHKPMTHFIEGYPSESFLSDTTAVRVREIK